MPVKYECPKCEKRFVDWGAEKLNFKCPTCPDEQLVKVGSIEDRPARKPTLRKRAKVGRVKEEEAPVEAGDAAEDEEYVEEPEEEEIVIGLGTEVVGKEGEEFDEDVVVEDEDGEISDEGDVPQDVEFGEDDGMGNMDIDEKL